MTDFGLTHFMVTMKFSGPQGIATRYGYHIPRIGDHVSFPVDEQADDGVFWVVMGTVRSVAWNDDAVYIDVTMGEELDAEAKRLRGLD